MNKPAHSTSLSSGHRKYSAVWQKLKSPPHKCEVKTTHADFATVVSGVKKEKNRDRNKPKFKRLDISSEEIPSEIPGECSTIKITFRLIDEISINTI